MNSKIIGVLLLALILLVTTGTSAQMMGEGMMKGDQTEMEGEEKDQMPQMSMMHGMMDRMMGMMRKMMESIRGMAKDQPTKKKMDEMMKQMDEMMKKHDAMMERMMGEDGMGMHKGTGMHGMMDMMGMMRAASHLDLTPDQKKQVKRLRLEHQKEAIPIFGKIRITGIELQELLLTDPVNLEKVKAKIKEKHDAMEELDLSHLLLMQKFKALLNPEQRQRLESMTEMGSMMGHKSGKSREKKGHEDEAE